MAEWSKAPLSKSGRLERVSRVRIPPFPHYQKFFISVNLYKEKIGSNLAILEPKSYNKDMKNSQKGFIVPLLMVIAILVVGGGIYYSYSHKTQKPIIVSVITEKTISDQDIVGNCKTLIASDWNKGVQCILDLGKSISSSQVCDSLKDTVQSKDPNVQKQDFVSLCKISLATTKKDASICLSISSYSDKYTIALKNTCLLSVAKLTKDQAICSNVVGDSEKNICVANTKNGAEQCQTFSTDDQKNYCYNTLASHDKDVKICDNITSGKNAENDKEFCIATVAQRTSNWQMCNIIKTVTTKDFCVAQVIELNKLDRKLCDNAGSRKDLCYAYPR